MATLSTRARTAGTFFVAILISVSVIISSPQRGRREAALLGTGNEDLYADENKIAVMTEDDVSISNSERLNSSFGLAKKPIDLTIYVVFHNQLLDYAYSELRVPLLPPPDLGEDDNGEREKLWRPNKDLNDGNEVIFLSTNPSLNKSINSRNPLFQGRVFREWKLQGYDSMIGARMNEYGAMWSVFKSNWTGQNQKMGADSHGFVQGKEEWIGFVQYDMRIDSLMIRRLRNGISQNAFVKVTPKRALRRTTPKPGHIPCCAFGGVLYPSQYLLHNALGFLLLQRYNTFFRTSKTLKDLPAEAFLDMFIVPAADFNRFMPFLGDLMKDLLSRTVRYPDPSVPVSALGNFTYQEAVAPKKKIHQGGSADPRKWRKAKGLDVMEAALALTLSFELRHVQIPIRHFKSVAGESSDDEDYD